MVNSYWDKVAQILRDTPSSKLEKLSEEMYRKLKSRLKHEGWFDSEDVCNCLYTAFDGGEIKAFGFGHDLSTELEAANRNEKSGRDANLDQADLRSISCALYLDMKAASSDRGGLEQEDVSNSLGKILRALPVGA